VFKGNKLDLGHQHPLPFGTYASFNYAGKEGNKYVARSENGIILRLSDDTTKNVIGYNPLTKTKRVYNSYTIIKATPSDFKLMPRNLITSQLPDLLELNVSLSGHRPRPEDEDGIETQMMNHDTSPSSTLPTLISPSTENPEDTQATKSQMDD
jgi:hypothetical protein